MSPITTVAFGSGGVDDNKDPIPPRETQTALTNEVARYPIDSVDYPDTPPPTASSLWDEVTGGTTARYIVTIPAADLAGVRINEAGLLDSEGNLCAIQTFYDKGKDGGLAFRFTFLDKF